MKLISKPVAAAVALALGAPSAFAGHQFLHDRVTFTGFGSIGGAQTNTDNAEFRRDYQQSGAREDIELDLDSNLGLQLTADLTSWLSGTVQTLTMHRGSSGITTQVEWAYLKVQPTEKLTAMVGRMTLPMFLVSDFRYVNYANNWVRPPNEVYGLSDLHRLEGASLSYAFPIRGTKLTATLLTGESKAHGNYGTLDAEDVRGGTVQWETDWVTLRAGRVSSTNILGFAGLRDRYTFSGIGASVDRNNVVAQAEMVTRRSAGFDFAVDSDGWYTMAGYRLNKFLPYVSYAHTEPKVGPPGGHLSETQSTLAAGLRWDAFSSSAIKLQVEHIDTDNTAGISFMTPTFLAPSGQATLSPVTESVTAVSLTMDVVF